MQGLGFSLRHVHASMLAAWGLRAGSSNGWLSAGWRLERLLPAKQSTTDLLSLGSDLDLRHEKPASNCNLLGDPKG